ncbi:uncharacterized protein LOC110998855 [Pieris rapae]|uniref:uncharacterized protein LOC110998855 n=1 Tax=Pieris rapae TaxID=64459 RepID=UPI001E27A84C|nr:uncharacterized protein LOC110998855 [Pieris rapae]
MSLKIKCKTPRAMPAEAVLTRSKLAQLKQNKIQKKVKIPENESLRLKNGKRKISVDKVQCKELQPDKVKRKIELKKVKLNPKHNQIVIADMKKCNKRKQNVPKRDVPQASFKVVSTPPSDNEKSVFELITLVDGTQEMDDDDFLEILTCPSPVWWEDPPPGYSEDPISVEYKVKKEKPSREDNQKVKKIEMNITKENFIEENNTSVRKDNKNNGKFVNKSKNLETLLGYIKNRKHKSANVCDSIRKNELSININELKENNEVSENDKVMKNDFDDKSKNEIKPIINELNLEKSIKIDNLSENAIKVTERRSPLCIDLNSDETDHEDLMNVSLDDHSLFFLENIEIPIVNEL